MLEFVKPGFVKPGFLKPEGGEDLQLTVVTVELAYSRTTGTELQDYLPLKAEVSAE